MEEKLSVVKRNQHDVLMAAHEKAKIRYGEERLVQKKERLVQRKEERAQDIEQMEKENQEMLEKFSQLYYAKSIDDFAKEGIDVRDKIERICTRYCRIRSHGTALPVYGIAGAAAFLSIFVSPFWFFFGPLVWAFFSLIYGFMIFGDNDGFSGVQKNAHFCNKWFHQIEYLWNRYLIRRFKKKFPTENKKEIAAHAAHSSP